MRKPCCDKEGNNKGAWSKQEDQKLIDYIRTHGEGAWRSLPKAAGLHRCGKSCRLRWINYLRPDIKRGNFAQDEEDLIIKLHALLGNRWSLIAGRLPGRTDNEVKNYWNSHIKKKLLNMGIDPNNHKLSKTLVPLSRNQNCATDDDDDTSSRSSTMNADNRNKPVAAETGRHYKVVSDGTMSCLQQEDENNLSDAAAGQLNLDLTISFSLPNCDSNSSESKEHRVCIDDPPVNCRGVDLGASAHTLLLFR